MHQGLLETAQQVLIHPGDLSVGPQKEDCLSPLAEVKTQGPLDVQPHLMELPGQPEARKVVLGGPSAGPQKEDYLLLLREPEPLKES
jgi:hypothetical protein